MSLKAVMLCELLASDVGSLHRESKCDYTKPVMAKGDWRFALWVFFGVMQEVKHKLIYVGLGSGLGRVWVGFGQKDVAKSTLNCESLGPFTWP